MEILITTSVNPVLDAVAAAYAHGKLRQYFHERVTVGVTGTEDAASLWLLNELKVRDILRLEQTTEEFDVFILWNAVRDGVALELPPLIIPNRVIEIVDNGVKSQHDYSTFPKADVTVEPTALSTIVTERFQGRRLPIDPISTQLLYCAIYITTDNLKPELTTPRDRAALRYLQKQMNISLTLVRDLFVATHPQ